ncbi:hypothetical protein [Ectothiorhodospira shaposhnikovii]|uniref:hypothetical protein n=1 Tax=Ectothiorhodospira shaposhnikovii TaxID=1054 RepID=UPI00399F3C19
MNTEPAARASRTTSRKPIATLGTAPAVKPKTAKNPVVIYAFHCTEGSRGVYVGKHEVRKGDPRQWSSSGVGKLPSGYGGSGNWVKNARAKYGDDAFRWFVLEVVEPGQDYANAEARAVAAAREEFGEGCKNIQNGGDGYDGEASRKLWENPAHQALISESMSRAWGDPEYRARIREASQQAWEDPAYRARATEQNKLNARAAWGDPDFRERMNARRSGLQKRLAAATKRRDWGQQPLPLDNLCLEAFDQPRNPLPCVVPKEPRSEALGTVLEALRQHPEGLTVPALCSLLDRPETGSGGVRDALSDLRKHHQPILNEGGIFVLLGEGSY